MASVIVICIEKKSDGSGNRKGHFRPNINVFTSLESAKIALTKFLNEIYDDYEDLDEDVETLVNRTIQDGILILSEWLKIRVTHHVLNPNNLISSTLDW